MVEPRCEMVSPGSPITLFTRIGYCRSWSPGARWNTTMSPRWIVEDSLSTIIRSPGSSVGVIDADGTTNACTAYARKLVVMMPMAATVTNSVKALRTVGDRLNQLGMRRLYV